MKGTTGFTGTNIRSQVLAGDENLGIVTYVVLEARRVCRGREHRKGRHRKPGTVLSWSTGPMLLL